MIWRRDGIVRYTEYRGLTLTVANTNEGFIWSVGRGGHRFHMGKSEDELEAKRQAVEAVDKIRGGR